MQLVIGVGKTSSHVAAITASPPRRPSGPSGCHAPG
jgi:hypothetical protein